MSLTESTLLLLFALFLVLLNGFFVAAEFAIVKLRHTRIEELRRLHGVRGRVLALVHKRLDVYLSACQLGITLASLGLGWIGEPAFARLLETPLQMLGIDNDPETIHAIAFVVAFATISYLHIVVGEQAPKSAALRKPELISLWTAVPLYLFYWLMYPFIWCLNASANWMLRRAGLEEPGGQRNEVPYSHDELRMIMHLSRAAAEEQHSDVNRMLTHLLDLPQLQASDVMRNSRELVGIPGDASYSQVRRTLQRHRFSRYPVFDQESGEALGVLHLKDIFLEGPGEDFPARLRARMLPVERVLEDTPVAQLLRNFRLGAPHLALVEDENRRTIGFVTMEDALEAVFGDITDEHGKERATEVDREPRRLRDGSLLVRGDTPLFLLERELGESIPESVSLSTVAGLLLERLGHLPGAGETLDIGSYTASVRKVSGTRIESVQITRRAE
jgi:CBS domain containing-hemolysin-like protein